jgi:RNA polymerase sigma-70 factor (ECF subfamily)
MASSKRVLQSDAPATGESELSLAELLELVAGGDQGAFLTLYQRVSPKVLGTARSIVLTSSYAEEVTQEVFLEIWRLAGRFDRSKGTAMSWIMLLTRSRSVDRVRQTAAARLRDCGYARHQRQRFVEEVLDGIVRRSTGRQLRTAVAELSPVRREAITLTYFGGLTYAQASAHAGVPLGTMKTRIRDGLRALSEQAATLV